MKTLEILKSYDKHHSNFIFKYIEYIKLYKTKSTVDTYSSSIKNFYDFIKLYYSTISYLIVNRKTLEEYIAYQKVCRDIDERNKKQQAIVDEEMNKIYLIEY